MPTGITPKKAGIMSEETPPPSVSVEEFRQQVGASRRLGLSPKHLINPPPLEQWQIGKSQTIYLVEDAIFVPDGTDEGRVETGRQIFSASEQSFIQRGELYHVVMPLKVRPHTIGPTMLVEEVGYVHTAHSPYIELTYEQHPARTTWRRVKQKRSEHADSKG